MRIGIDVGGTHTDAVLLEDDNILSSTKSLTTEDVTSGIMNALSVLLSDSGIHRSQVSAIMIGTTQFTNAVVERRELTEVGIIRLALPSGKGCPPLTDWPEDLANAVGRHVYTCSGGYLYDGYPIADIDHNELDNVVSDIKQKGLTSIAIASAFSTMNPEPELMVYDKIKKAIPNACVSLSHNIGSLGLLERENAAILNAALLPFANKIVSAFISALKKQGFTCPMYISQNDGTLMNADFVKQYPALTFASGPTNSLRGAYKLSGLEDAIVVDIGGTTSDIGVLQKGFPRQSNVVIDVGGVRTNFRMPDIKAIGLGGGSLVSNDGKQIGPQSCGHNLLNQGLIFGGDTLTTTDIAVAAGYTKIGNAQLVKDLSPSIVANANKCIQSMLDSNIEMMKPNATLVPVILVGGGAVLVSGNLTSASEVIRPPNAGVANAIGAAIAQVGGEAESLQSYKAQTREHAIQKVTKQAIDRAVAAGANTNTINVVDIEEIDVPYMDDDMTRIRVKVLGELA